MQNLLSRSNSAFPLAIACTASCRARLDPQIPSNYFGNCVTPKIVLTEAETLMEENGIVFAVQKLRDRIQSLEKGALEGAKDIFAEYITTDPSIVEIFGVAGSTRFEVYGSDFGWGRPKKVEIASIDRTATTTSFSMAESKGGSGGVEIGLVLKKHEMEMFESLFVNGLKDHIRPIN